MHLPESIGYITRKLERALKLAFKFTEETAYSGYITRKLERALKQFSFLSGHNLIFVI